MARIGIMTCANVTDGVGCGSAGCIGAIQGKAGIFEKYDNVELAGIINCAGCPTLVAPEKVLRKVRALVDLNIDAIHFSGCMKDFCPFKNKYKAVIEKKYPGVEVVMGTHSDMPEEPHKIFLEEMKKTLSKDDMNLLDLVKKSGAM